MASTCDSYQKLFLRGYPIKLLLPDVLKIVEDGNEAIQKTIVESTVRLPIVEQYPLKTEYMLAFLKSFITELEHRGVDICDELYETYCKLLNNHKGKRETHYRHFMLDDCLENCITIEESTKAISQGTTGLYTWQASQALVNWCMSHEEEVQNKCILELGSGVGLAGLAVCISGKPKSFCFSDCHMSVLKLLHSNIQVNVNRSALSDSYSSLEVTTPELPQPIKDISCFHGKLKDTDVHILNLPWEDIPSSDISNVLCPDIILAADVVYDTVSFVPLCKALSHLVRDHCFAVLACTVRNEDTLNEFLELIGKHQLSINVERTEISCASSDLLCLDEVPIKVFKICRPDL